MTGWPRHLLSMAITQTIILLAFHRDAIHLVNQWNSSTFAHCWLIPPIIGWLVWTRRVELAKLQPQAWWPGLIWIAAGAFVWLLGDAASVALFRHTGLILMLQGLVPTLLGPQIVRGLAFPIFYALFLIPFGEELIPPMQLVTADMAMFLLRITGIPAFIDGIFITTPGGHFAVAEACSGVKFLVAMAALSVLVAHLCFRTWQRRALFVAFALVVPVLANGFRAYSTIWMAEAWGTEFAVGADHLIYGWVFFGVVMALIYWIASPWFDRAADDKAIDVACFSVNARKPANLAPAALIALLLAATPLTWNQLQAANSDPMPPFTAPTVTGWTAVAGTAPDWRARFDGADQRGDGLMRDSAGHVIDITLVGYARQGEGRELVGFGQGAVDPDSDWKWGQGLDPIGPARVDRIADGDIVRDVLTAYIIGGEVTSNPRTVKWRTLTARFTGSDQRAYALLLSAQPSAGQSGRDRIAAFVEAAGGIEPLARSLTNTDP